MRQRAIRRSAPAWRRLEGNFSRSYWLLVDPAKQFAIKARGAGGQAVTATLDGVTAEARKHNQNPVNNETKANLQKLDWSNDNLAFRSQPRRRTCCAGSTNSYAALKLAAQGAR